MASPRRDGRRGASWAITAPGPLERHPLVPIDLTAPEPGPGQVRLRVLACGVCRTDLHQAEGDVRLPRTPIVPGHQVVGRVECAGPKSPWRQGDRVGVPWLHQACGRCAFCRAGAENLCDRARFTGLHVHGGYAPRMLAREAFCVPIPPSLPDVKAAPLLCAGVIGLRALRIAATAPGETVGLFGFGGSAHIALQVLRYWRCRVLVFTRGALLQELARRLGADWVGPPNARPPTPLDRAVSFAPAGALIPLALGALRKGGVLALAGIHIDRIPEMPYALLFGERVLRSVTAATRGDARELLELAARIPLRAETRSFPLDRANEALLLLKAGRLAGSAVLLP